MHHADRTAGVSVPKVSHNDNAKDELIRSVLLDANHDGHVSEKEAKAEILVAQKKATQRDLSLLFKKGYQHGIYLQSEILYLEYKTKGRIFRAKVDEESKNMKIVDGAVVLFLKSKSTKVEKCTTLRGELLKTPIEYYPSIAEDIRDCAGAKHLRIPKLEGMDLESKGQHRLEMFELRMRLQHAAKQLGLHDIVSKAQKRAIAKRETEIPENNKTATAQQVIDLQNNLNALQHECDALKDQNAALQREFGKGKGKGKGKGGTVPTPSCSLCTRMQSVYTNVEDTPPPENEIWYQDDRVCILHPDCVGGVLVRSQVLGMSKSELLKEGLKSGKQLAAEGNPGKRKYQWPYIFFRAPYQPVSRDQSSCNAELAIAAYGDQEVDCTHIYIRVDPTKTYVYSSEIRTRETSKLSSGNEDDIQCEVEKSKKLLSWYFDVLEENQKSLLPKPWDPKSCFVHHSRYSWNLFSSELVLDHTGYPFDDINVARASEILVELDVIPPHVLIDVDI